MAFICDWCREKLLDDKGNLQGFVKSKGTCELCNTTDICNDLANYKCKTDWQDILKNQTDRKMIDNAAKT
jgi:hypothetical protein